jgi:hypothetical protein
MTAKISRYDIDLVTSTNKIFRLSIMIRKSIFHEVLLYIIICSLLLYKLLYIIYSLLLNIIIHY